MRRIRKTIVTPSQLFELGMQQEILGRVSSSSNERSLKGIVHYIICPVTFLECHLAVRLFAKTMLT